MAAALGRDKAGGPMMPHNATTGVRYRGMNTIMLGMSPLAFVSGDPRWATYKQAADRGWQVRKGSRGTPGFFYKRIEVEDRDGGSEDGRKVLPLLRAFTLFHASQIEGIPPYLPPSVEQAPWREPDAAATIARNSGAVIRTGGDRAFYSPGTDHVQIPPTFAFRSPAAYASVLLHELGHWTGRKGPAGPRPEWPLRLARLRPRGTPGRTGASHDLRRAGHRRLRFYEWRRIHRGLAEEPARRQARGVPRSVGCAAHRGLPARLPPGIPRRCSGIRRRERERANLGRMCRAARGSSVSPRAAALNASTAARARPARAGAEPIGRTSAPRTCIR